MADRASLSHTLIAVAASSLLGVSCNAQAASFDCSKAKTTAEVAICNDPGLSALDDELASLYKKALAATKRSGQKRQLENQQSRFIERQRARCENDVPCLTRVYESRIAQLRQRTGAPTKPTGSNVGKEVPAAQPLDALFSPIWDVPANTDHPAAGFWLAEVKCKRGSAEAVIFISKGSGASRVEGLIKYHSPEIPQPHASGFSLLTGARNADGSYDFVTDNRPSYSSRGASGQMLGAFEARIYAEKLEGRFSAGSCESFSAVRLRPDSDYLRAARGADGTSGSFNQGDRCKAVLDWMARLEESLPPDWYTSRPLEQAMPLASLLYADADFVPVFGKPYDQTGKEWRIETGRWLQRECLGDRITRQKLIKYSSFLYFSDIDYLKIEPRIRQIRRLRYELAELRVALAKASLDKAVPLAEKSKALTKTFSFLLWPHEAQTVIREAHERLTILARPETDKILARFEQAAPGLDILLEADRVLANFDTQVFGFLPPDERQAKRQRLQSRRSVFAAGTVEPILARARATTTDLEGFHAIARILEEENSFVSKLPLDIRQSLDGELNALQQKHLEFDISTTTASLNARSAGKAALEASAEWKARFDQRYGSLAENPAVRAALSNYLDHRKELLLASIEEFEAELAGVPSTTTDAQQQAAALLRQYLVWDKDRSLPQSLEYDFAINQWSPAPVEIKDDEE